MSDAVVVAIIAAIASIVTVCLQVRSSKESKKYTTKRDKASSENMIDLKSLIKQNTDAVDRVRNSLDSNNRVTVATARTAIKSIYDRLSPNKKITMTEKAMIAELYSSYKSVTLPDGHHPNSWCDQIVREIDGWEVIPDASAYTRMAYSGAEPKKNVNKKAK